MIQYHQNAFREELLVSILGKNPVRCCLNTPVRQHCTRKNLFNDLLILLGQHCTGKTLVQCCSRGSGNIAQEKILFNIVLILFVQHSSGKILVQCCPRGSRKYYTGKIPVQCCLNTLGTTLRRYNPCVMLSKKLQTTLNRSIKLFIAVSILLRQHHTKKILVQCCPRSLRQHCTGKNTVQCCLNTLGTTLHR